MKAVKIIVYNRKENRFLDHEELQDKAQLIATIEPPTLTISYGDDCEIELRDNPEEESEHN